MQFWGWSKHRKLFSLIYSSCYRIKILIQGMKNTKVKTPRPMTVPLEELALIYRCHEGFCILKPARKDQHLSLKKKKNKLLTLSSWKPNLTFVSAMRSFTLPKVSGSMFCQSVVE